MPNAVFATQRFAGGVTPTVYASSQQLSGSNTGTTGIPTTLTVTLDGPVPPGGGTTTISAAGATLSTSTLTWTFGGATSQTFTITRATAGGTTVGITNSMGLANGTSLSYTSSAAPSAGTPSPFTLTSATSGTLPFTVGHAFRQGDIPSGSGIAIAGATAQATIKNAWPDGSAKFAIIAGSYTSAGSAVTVTPSAGTASTGTALTTADLIATGITAEFGTGGTFGIAAFGNAEWAAPFQSWVSGHRMSSWVYRKQIGADAHLVAWLEVRLYLGGAVEVLPWIENGYVNVASPTNKSATYTFTLGGTVRNGGQVIDLKHHQRTPLVAGTALSYWLATDPGVVPLHDKAYMQATELVPTMWATVAAGSSLVTALPTTYTPLQQGSFTYNQSTADYMPNPGYAAPIGLLPEHDVLHLVADQADRQTTYRGVIRNGYGAGRYGIHYRDENTNRPIIPTNHVGTCVPDSRGVFGAGGAYSGGANTPAVSGGNPPIWDTAHCPSMGYMAYLLTGMFYHLETAQFATGINYLARANLAVQRGTAGEGFLQIDVNSVGTRDAAWGFRTLVQALAITPTTDAWHDPWRNVLQNNLDRYQSLYVAQANNPLGFTKNGTTAYTGFLNTLAPWQQDFMTAAWGYGSLLGIPVQSGYSVKWDAVFDYMAQSITFRLGDTSGWPWQNPALYNIRVSATNTPDWDTGTGPWYTAAQAYSNSTGALGWLASTSGNTIGDENIPGSYPAAARSYLGNLMPALSYAVRKGASGAAAGYNKLVGATNWASITTAFNTSPVWGVKPASGLTPAWAASAPLNTWMAVPNSAGAGGTAVDAFCGWALREDTGELFIAAAGGHLNSSDNRVASFSLLADSPSWTTRLAASASVQNDVSYYADGRPSSRHTYTHTHWIPSLNRLMLIGARFVFGPGVVEYQTVDGFNPSTNTFDTAGTYPNIQAGYYGVARDSSDRVLCMWGRRIWSAGTTTGSGTASASTDVRGTWCWDGSKSRMFGIACYDGEGFDSGGGVRAKSVDMATGTITDLTINASAGYTQLQADAPAYAGLTYDPLGGRYFLYAGSSSGQAGRVYVITYASSTNIDIAIWTHGSGGTTLPQSDTGGINGKFTYVPQLSGIVAMPTKAGGAYYMRLA